MDQHQLTPAHSFHIDCYRVLELDHDCTEEEIEGKYVELSSRYHPDKVRARHQEVVRRLRARAGGIDSERMQELDTLLNQRIIDAKTTFNLVNTAYRKLTTDRQHYDDEYNRYQAESGMDHLSMKSHAQQYMDSQKSLKTVDDDLAFQRTWQEMNKRHGFDSDQASIAFTAKEFEQRIDELKNSREREEKEITPTILFDPTKPLDHRRFNAAYNLMHKSHEGAFRGDIQPIDMSAGWSDFAAGSPAFSTVEHDNLYDDSDPSNGAFASVREPVVAGQLLTADDIAQLDPSALWQQDVDASDPDYQRSLEARLSDYQRSGDELSRMGFEDFSTDVMYGGVLDRLGGQQQTTFEHLEFADNADVRKKYSELLASRQ
jgi:curved DNA-binding protein CbpA